MIQCQCDSVVYFTFDLFTPFPALLSAVSTRLGGVSSPPYQSLNLGFHVGDSPGDVWRNRRILCAALGIDAEVLTVGQQVHGIETAVVTEQERGRGSFSWEQALPATDALITDRRGVALLVLIADCCALSFYDPSKNVIALAHAGWRGLLGGIAVRTVAMMRARFGCEPREMRVGLAPCIGSCCYKVGEDVQKKFATKFGAAVSFFFRRGEDASIYLDLVEVARYQLMSAGILEKNIEVAGICTACHTELFYSHRAEGGVTGRFGSLIMLRE